MKKYSILVVAVFLSGCAAKQYFHTSLTDQHQVERQQAIDDAYCTEVSVGAAPMPQLVVQPSGSGTYQSSGTISGYNTQTGYSNYNYSGTTRQIQSPANAFAQGFANGTNIANAIAAREARDKIHHGCMLAKGWSEDKDKATALAAKHSLRQAADDKWRQTVDLFLRTEASRPDGIDYRADEFRFAQLNSLVKILANDPKNDDKTTLWFLIEADRLVKRFHPLEVSQQEKTN